VRILVDSFQELIHIRPSEEFLFGKPSTRFDSRGDSSKEKFLFGKPLTRFDSRGDFSKDKSSKQSYILTIYVDNCYAVMLLCCYAVMLLCCYAGMHVINTFAIHFCIIQPAILLLLILPFLLLFTLIVIR
jgi:hypothetical protein